MSQRMRLRRPRSWVVLLCVAAGLGLFAAPNASATTSAAPNASAPTSAKCDTQVNDTPSKLVACIQTDDLWNHMKKFQAIADANPSPADGHPSRNSGEPGYKASADYVAKAMSDAGYDVTIQPYTFTYYAYTAPPVFRETSPTAQDYTTGVDWNPGQSVGTTTAAVQPA